DYYRALAHEKNRDERDQKFSENLAVSITRLHSLAFAASPSLPEATMDYRIETTAYAACSGKRMFVPLTKCVPLRRSLPGDDPRVLDLYLPDGYSLSDTVVIHIPAGYTAENVPANQKIASEFGSYELQIAKTADQLYIIRRAEIRPVAVPPARYGEVRQFYLAVAKGEGAQAVLVKTN
ncbi:MAG: DUF3858 domain-containing protein, partial [Saprospiraceae bacterium]|nr:DUF3858 domain-containing protein [Saprospiraceae bacterium]